jgi:predicted GNAT superfamily acetyltransferase
MQFRIRNATSADLPAVLAMNEAAVPHVNSLSPARMQDLHVEAAWFRVAARQSNDELSAFLIGLAPDAKYDSPNFLWFCRNYPSFAYIDRIAVADDARRSGLGTALYDDFEAAFSNRVPLLVCEVNLRPANPASMEFHRRRGFTQAGSQVIDDGNKEVAMMVKQLTR